MYVYTGSLHHLEYFDFSCASIPDGWWQFVKEELIYIYIIHIIFIYILYILHVQMLFFIFNFLPLPRPPSCSQEVACFRFMMRLTDHVPFLCPLLLTFLLSFVTLEGQLYMAWNSFWFVAPFLNFSLPCLSPSTDAATLATCCGTSHACVCSRELVRFAMPLINVPDCDRCLGLYRIRISQRLVRWVRVVEV